MGGQTHPTFHPTLVFSMLDEMLDAFDQGFTGVLSTVGSQERMTLPNKIF